MRVRRGLRNGECGDGCGSRVRKGVGKGNEEKGGERGC